MEMDDNLQRPLAGLDEFTALQTILEGTAEHTGDDFFRALVLNLAKSLGTQGAWVTEYSAATREMRSLAFIMGGNWIDEYEYPVDGTPCELVVERAELIHHPDNVIDLYPGDNDLGRFGAVSFMGAPLLDTDGCVMGHLAVLDSQPLPHDESAVALMRIFANRATAEIRRIRREQEIAARKEQFVRLVSSAMDGIVGLDDTLQLELLNPAAERVFQRSSENALGQPVSSFLTAESADKLRELAVELRANAASRSSLWIPGGLQVRAGDGSTVPVEATLALSRVEPDPRYTVILRDVNERIEAEKRIGTLTAETEYLRQQLQTLRPTFRLVGNSPALRKALDAVDQVADTDATVLLTGETGTGKEIFARAIHEASARSGNPLIKVNCAAIPAALMESEFFGHERGAFTGATARRKGRFALADEATIFLDEIAELSLELQAKLLRVLQEGEFEAIGSSETQKIDVRVIAATNRDLAQLVDSGRFREDLYYRLNVFPIQVPPLRERGEDIVRLAEHFAAQFAQSMGVDIQSLRETDKRMLMAYDWPGNVRELQNVIERAVITSTRGILDLALALPEANSKASAVPEIEGNADRVLTVSEMRDQERENIRRALEATDWKVSGPGGAAELLEMRPSTLSSRIKALGIHRNRRS